MHCPSCQSNDVIRNGLNAMSKQIYRCKNCGRQFVLCPSKSTISDDKKKLIDRLLLERISLAGISRSVDVSESWLQDYVNKKYENEPRTININSIPIGTLTIECDEMWSYVEKHDNKQWIWLALDRDTRIVVSAYVGDRSEASAQALWNALPLAYRERATSYTDYWAAYAAVFPPERHHAVGKDSGQTNHIERLNCTFRQRISRLVRKTLSFSKKLVNHIGAIWYFIHHYNDSIMRNLSPCRFIVSSY